MIKEVFAQDIEFQKAELPPISAPGYLSWLEPTKAFTKVLSSTIAVVLIVGGLISFFYLISVIFKTSDVP